MRKIFSSILIGLLLTVNVAVASEKNPLFSDTVASVCAQTVLPEAYVKGVTVLELMDVFAESCGPELLQEMNENDVPVTTATVAAGTFFYISEFLNAMLQDTLDYLFGGGGETPARETLYI